MNVLAYAACACGGSGSGRTAGGGWVQAEERGQREGEGGAEQARSQADAGEFAEHGGLGGLPCQRPDPKAGPSTLPSNNARENGS